MGFSGGPSCHWSSPPKPGSRPLLVWVLPAWSWLHVCVKAQLGHLVALCFPLPGELAVSLACPEPSRSSFCTSSPPVQGSCLPTSFRTDASRSPYHAESKVLFTCPSSTRVTIMQKCSADSLDQTEGSCPALQFSCPSALAQSRPHATLTRCAHGHALRFARCFPGVLLTRNHLAKRWD